jgi:hypothetical protein
MNKKLKNPNKPIKLAGFYKNLKSKIPKKRSTPRYKHLADDAESIKIETKKLKPEIKLSFIRTPELDWQPAIDANDKLLDINWDRGCQQGVADSDKLIDRELVIGVDFGTSSTKVVIADRTLKQAYAVPFTDGAGVMSYLLPTVLFEKNGFYSFDSDGVSHNDLKLSLMANPSDPLLCAKVAAYLSLVIQYSRSWLFEKYRDQYVSSEILWTLALGQPADQVTSSSSKLLFLQLGQVAWGLARKKAPISTYVAIDKWKSRDEKLLDTDEFHCLVLPELAAQIHGFVSSELFDPRLPNIFLMIDVGAGTVDASIFSVRKDKSGATNFSLFTNSVEAYGVANLHRYRIGWWQKMLSDLPAGKVCISDLQRIKLPTEYRGFFPPTFKEYLSGVELQFLNGALDPDEEFFSKINWQLVGEIFGKSKSKKLLGLSDIDGMPYFLCGGGARHAFYGKIKPSLQKPRGSTWLNLTPKALSFPKNLRAEGVTRSEYDRLSVAYGLSQLNLGMVKLVEAMTPLAAVDHYSKWGESYVDKDVC